MQHPEGTTLIELRWVYDGWSIAKLPDGTFKNRWEESDHRWKPTQEFIVKLQEEQNKNGQ